MRAVSHLFDVLPRLGAAPRPSPPDATRRIVGECYEFFDRVFPDCGLRDLTEGMYGGNPTVPYEEAQRRQSNWLLDQVGCSRGTRLLDVGCGYGRLLELAGQRGAQATGITISPAQVARCRAAGLDARELDYRAPADDWTGQFDAVVANGSIEHFVTPRDVVTGQADAVYRQMFRIFHRLIDPASPLRRLATTVIHRHAHSPRLRPRDLTRSPWAFRCGSPQYHYALLQNTFGGFYPARGQLARAAAPWFRLVGEVDGTDDYHLTSEECFRRVRRVLFSWRSGPPIWRRLASYFASQPRHALEMCWCLLVAESWQWQFRGADPPVRLLRQTWEYKPQS